MKAGVKTSEFWVLLIVTLLGALLTTGAIDAGGMVGKVAGAIIATASALGYGTVRAIVKAHGPKAVAFLLVVVLVGCATPDMPGVTGSGTASTRGGDADSIQPNIDAVLALGYPGSTTVAAPVRNEDRTQSTQAGDSPTLVLGGSGRAAKAVLDAVSPLEALIQKQIEIAFADREKEGADLAEIDSRLDRLKAELSVEYATKLKRAQAVAGSFEKLQTVVFAVLQLKLNGVPPDKLTADAIRAAAENMKAAMQPAANATD